MLARLFLELLKAFVIVGHLALWVAWMGTGLVIYLAPAFYAAIYTRAAAALVVVGVITGLLSIKVRALSRVVDVFHFGGRAILGGMEEMLTEVGRVGRTECDLET